MDFGSKLGSWEQLLLYSVSGAAFVLLLCVGGKLVRWAKGRPVGGYVILALFPLISLFPIPPTEIKKLERIKQEQVKRKQESGDPPIDDEPTPP